MSHVRNSSASSYIRRRVIRVNCLKPHRRFARRIPDEIHKSITKVRYMRCGNEKWLILRKVETFQKEIGIKDWKWFGYMAPVIKDPFSSWTFYQFSTSWGNKKLDLPAPRSVKFINCKNISTKMAQTSANDPVWMCQALKSLEPT